MIEDLIEAIRTIQKIIDTETSELRPGFIDSDKALKNDKAITEIYHVCELALDEVNSAVHRLGLR